MGEGQSNVSTSAVISHFFSLKYSICRCAVFWGSMYRSPSLDISDNFVIVTNYSHFTLGGGKREKKMRETSFSLLRLPLPDNC